MSGIPDCVCTHAYTKGFSGSHHFTKDYSWPTKIAVNTIGYIIIVKLPLLVPCTNPLEGCFVFSIVLLGLYDLLDVKLNM